MPRLPWFRMYYEARTDAKLRTLTDQQHRVWFNLLCLAAEQSERGNIPNNGRKLLAIEAAGGNKELLEETLTLLQELNIVDETEDLLRFVHFESRQYDYPSDLPEAVRERVQKHRNELKREETSGNTVEERRGEENRIEEIRVDKRTRATKEFPTWGHHKDQEEFTVSMISELADVFTAETVRLGIETAMAHSSRKKYSRLDLYVGNWLRRDATAQRDRKGFKAASLPGAPSKFSPAAIATEWKRRSRVK